MKKINLFIFALIFLSAALQVNAQTYCGTMQYTVELTGLSYNQSDGFLDSQAEAGIFDLTSVNPLNGQTQSNKACNYYPIPDESSSITAVGPTGFGTFNFGTTAGCGTMPDNLSITIGLAEDDGLFDDCDLDAGDDDECYVTSQSMSVLSLGGNPGVVTQIFTCGVWQIRVRITLSTFVPSPGDICPDPIKICTDASLTFNAETTGSAETGNNYGCLTTQPRPTWFYLETGVDGNIDMSLVASADVDFALWGPYANLAAATATCGSLPAPVDCSYSTSATEAINIPTSTAGQIWLMVVTNYAGTTQTFTLAKTGGTGDTDCTGVACPDGEVTVPGFNPTTDCNGDGTATFHLTIANPGDYTGPFTVLFGATGGGSGPVGLATSGSLAGPTIDIIATDPNPATFDAGYPGNFPASDDATTAIGNVRIFDANGCEVTGLNGFTSWDLGYDKLIDCPEPLDCTTAPVITCGQSTTTTLVGTGAWDVTTCGFSTPGTEAVYKFTSTLAGTYTLNITAASGGYIDYAFKLASGTCDATGWTCIDDNTSVGTDNFTLLANTDYYIVLDPEATTSMTHTWNISCPVPPPVNDVCSGAISLCGDLAETGLVDNATNETATNCGNTSVGNNKGLWFTFVGNGTSQTISTCGSSYDSEMRVFTGSCASLACVAGSALDADGCDGLDETFTFTTALGTTYYVLVTSHSATATGTYSVQVTGACPPVCPTATTVTSDTGTSCGTGGTDDLSAWQTAVATANPTGLVYSSVTPVAGTTAPDNTLPNGNNTTCAPITQTVMAYVYCDVDASGGDTAGDTYTLVSTYVLTVYPAAAGFSVNPVVGSCGVAATAQLICGGSTIATETGIVPTCAAPSQPFSGSFTAAEIATAIGGGATASCYSDLSYGPIAANCAATPTATVTTTGAICVTGTGTSTLDLSTLVTAGNTGGTWSLVTVNGTTLAGSTLSAGTAVAAATATVRYTIAATADCPENTYDATITVNDCTVPTATVDADVDDPCFCVTVPVLDANNAVTTPGVLGDVMVITTNPVNTSVVWNVVAGANTTITSGATAVHVGGGVYHVDVTYNDGAGGWAVTATPDAPNAALGVQNGAGGTTCTYNIGSFPNLPATACTALNITGATPAGGTYSPTSIAAPAPGSAATTQALTYTYDAHPAVGTHPACPLTLNATATIPACPVGCAASPNMQWGN